MNCSTFMYYTLIWDSLLWTGVENLWENGGETQNQWTEGQTVLLSQEASGILTSTIDSTVNSKWIRLISMELNQENRELLWDLGQDQGISKYFTTQVAPSRVKTLRKMAKLPQLELVPKFRENCLKQNSGPEWVFVGISVCVPYPPEFWDQFQLR